MQIWIVGMGVMFLSFLLPHDEVATFSVVSYSLQFLLFIVAFFVFRHEPTRKNQFIFLNFALIFSLSIVFHLYSFVSPLVKLFIYQYVSFGAYFFLIAMAIAYIAVDAIFRDFKVVQKYAITLAIVGGFFVYYYHPLLLNSNYLYQTDDIQDFRVLDKAAAGFRQIHNAEPSPEELAATVEMHSWKNGEPIGALYPAEKLARVRELYPYLSGSNYNILLSKPVYINSMYMCVFCLGFILLFFGYQYMKDPPQGAYIDKIMFMFLLFCSMEAMHAWSFVKSLEWQTFYEIASVGQYLSIVVFCFIALFFALRLKFITSVNGEFYEQEIASSPQGVTRWRDWLDDLLVAHFFNRKAISGRLFVDPRRNK